ncbi:RecQ family ATP-dependent DNA helicase [Aridibaculum aurantiacum]|uniref:RecQ family ATP-dependent DNA helicase n=1 Tax=Aridibaculum aurantiacum TaxID=2810307 RepID=UPI001A97B8A1|nr:ATP-dependent DNA helicase RecQ [Aridibaculum aurantiacum]
MPSPHEILQQYWGYSSFRPLQKEIIQSVLDGKDVLALLPTGGGKSICFQVPAMVNEGICLVISPLIALMKDQVHNLKKKNIPALSIYSGMSHYEVKETLQNACYGHYKFLYVSPERLETQLFKEYLPALKLNLIAVDEAHCISQWGYDFRPPYLRIAKLRSEFPNVPILALTASATPVVQKDICDKLHFANPGIFRQSFARDNLSMSAFNAESKINKLVDILQKVPGSAIVYCRNRKKTKEIAHLLHLNHISADYYHAGLLQADRSHKQERWIKNEITVIVCTNAFGMGIDKPDVRVVVHVDIPDNLENYYQEAGRAGRDGKRSFAVLLYTQQELAELKELPAKKYPSVKDIRDIYQAVANFLQLPVGSGEGQYFDFNLNDFVRKFKLETIPVVNALKALEQEGHLAFNEQVFISTKISFSCSKETLHAFEASHPAYDNVVKYLLRTYEGIFDNLVSVNENLLARLTKLSTEELQQQLKALQAFGIIEYHPQKETPQLFFLQDRAPAEYLVFNQHDYLKRKEEYKLRVQAMEQYVMLQDKCRSQYIGHYFGDTELQTCSSCDNCLEKKNSQLTDEEFKIISQRILHHISSAEADIKLLLDHMKGLKKEKVWQVLDYLQAEGKLSVDAKGLIRKA